MQKLFSDTRKLDSSCRASYGLSEEIMMENAASALENQIRKNAAPGQSVFILCGGGNNGADGYALSRKLNKDFDVSVYSVFEAASEECVLQKARAEKCGVPVKEFDKECAEKIGGNSVAVDCIFGSGFHGEFSGENAELIKSTFDRLNKLPCLKIACDVPSGIHQDGTVCSAVFAADITVSMGALKMCLFSDGAKDFAGTVVCANLGVSRTLYENSSEENLEPAFLLEESDLALPFRRKNCVNKGTFGTAYIACGEKSGAGCIAARACLKFGAGLATLIRPEENFSKTGCAGLTAEILTAEKFGGRVDALAVGMGLGHDEDAADFYFSYLKNNRSVPAVLDADVFYSKQIKSLLKERAEGCVLTPHPKEFAALLKSCALGEYSVSECAGNRAPLIKKFCLEFPNAVLLVKGANPMIGVYTDAEGFRLFVNPLGSPALAKGGSGDVLSGMICALLAQGYSPLDAALSGSLAHAMAGRKFKNNFALTPSTLTEALGEL